MPKAPTLAKTTRPRPADVYRRTRLFRLLDRARARPVTWVCGPPGAGKTTLIASYLEARRPPPFWYQLDGGDADPAAFFYYLRAAAARAAPRYRRPLPLLSPEYLAGLPTFTRRVFQALYGRLKPPFVAVFDDYHELPEDTPLHGLMAVALAEVPPGGRVFVLSRGEPPPALARLQANRTMALVRGEQLRLTPRETAGLARVQRGGRLPAGAARALHEATQGWAAGLVLLLERLKSGGPGPPPLDGLPPQALFDYFAGEILAKTDAETRQVLLWTAVLPRATARMAEALTGSPGAGRILAGLARTHYFTTQHAGAEPAYEYHPLFRRFLLAQARETLPPARWRALQGAAAALLEASGQVRGRGGPLPRGGRLGGAGAPAHRPGAGPPGSGSRPDASRVAAGFAGRGARGRPLAPLLARSRPAAHEPA